MKCACQEDAGGYQACGWHAAKEREAALYAVDALRKYEREQSEGCIVGEHFIFRQYPVR